MTPAHELQQLLCRLRDLSSSTSAATHERVTRRRTDCETWSASTFDDFMELVTPSPRADVSRYHTTFVDVATPHFAAVAVVFHGATRGRPPDLLLWERRLSHLVPQDIDVFATERHRFPHARFLVVNGAPRYQFCAFGHRALFRAVYRA